jgi:glycosyltransferase involved in cell wall biosynthesis
MNKKEKNSIGIVTYNAPGKTGVGTTAWNHAKMLAAENHSVYFITPENISIPEEKNIKQLKITTHPTLRSLYWSCSQRITLLNNKSIQANDIDLLKFANATKNNLTKIVKQYNIKTIMFTESFLEGSLWQPPLNCKILLRFACPRYLFNEIGLSKQPINKYLKNIEKNMLKKASYLYAPTNKMASLSADYFNIPLNSIKVIPNPIDTSLFNPNKSIPKKTAKICFAGRYTKEKGAEIINSIIPDLMQYFPQITFSVAGNSGIDKNGNSYIKLLEKKLIENQTIDRFKHFNFIPNTEMPDFYRRHNILLYPSLFDSFSMVIAEAQSCGLAIISSDAGGIPEVVKNNKTGYTIPVGDLKKTKNLLQKLIEDQELCCKIGINAAKHQFALSAFKNVYTHFIDIL